MAAEQTIAEIECFERIFAGRDIRPQTAGPERSCGCESKARRNVRAKSVVSPLAAVWSLLPRRVPNDPAWGKSKARVPPEFESSSSVSTFQWGGKIHVCAHQSECGDHRTGSAERSLASSNAEQRLRSLRQWQAEIGKCRVWQLQPEKFGTLPPAPPARHY